MALELSSLVVKPFERAELFRSPQFCFLDRRFQHLNGLVVHAERHRKRMPVLAAVGDGESRRVGEAVRRILIRSLHLRVLKSGCCFEHTWRRAALVQPCSLRHSAETHPEGSTAVGFCSYPASGGTGSSNLFPSADESFRGLSGG